MVSRMASLVRVFFALSLLGLLSACKPAAEEPPPKEQTLKDRTKVLQAADLAGYDGKQLEKSANDMLDKTKKHNEELEKAMQNQ